MKVYNLKYRNIEGYIELEEFKNLKNLKKRIENLSNIIKHFEVFITKK